MKKLLIFILSAAMLLTFAACGDAREGETEMTTEDNTFTEETTADGEETTVKEEETKDIAAVYPKENATVVLANDDVYGWWSTFHMNKTDTQPFYQHADIYFPVPVPFEWTKIEGTEYYRVYISLNEDMSEADSYLVNGTTLVIDTLFTGKTYYWQVDAVSADETVRGSVHSFQTARSPRTFKVEGVSNTRDAGGYDTVDGGRMKQGMIYRGGKLEDITANGIVTFHDILGIKTDLDLRTTGEGGAGVKSPLGDDVKYVNINGRYYIGAMGISTDEGKLTIAEEMRIFVDPANYPVYIHCSLGRDRTGTLVMLLQGLAGVGKSDIMMDYELSIFSVTGTLDNASISALRSNLRATYDYISQTFEGESFSVKVEKYLLSCGMTAEEIAAIRDNLCE
jgi:hypothetical protein